MNEERGRGNEKVSFPVPLLPRSSFSRRPANSGNPYNPPCPPAHRPYPVPQGDCAMRRCPLVMISLFALSLLLAAHGPVRADDWPQWLGPQRDGVWRETGILDKFPAGGPKVRWRMPVGGGYAGPAVADGRVYVADRVLAPGVKDPDNPFKTSNSDGEERLWCLKESDGSVLWKKSYPCTYQLSYAAGPRATPPSAAVKSTSWGRWAICTATTPRPATTSGQRISSRTRHIRRPCRRGVSPPIRCSTATNSSASSAARTAWSSPSTRTPARRNGGNCQWRRSKSAIARR